MSTHNTLPRYDLGVCFCAQGPHLATSENVHGEWARAEDALAVIAKLEARIAALGGATTVTMPPVPQPPVEH